MPTADELIGPDVARQLVAVIGRAVPGRPLPALRSASAALAPLALRQRSDLLADALLADLAGDGGDDGELEAVVDAALADETFSGWMIWPVSEALTTSALRSATPAAIDAALDRLAMLTPRFTGEFAIRPLLEADLDRAVPIVLAWTRHPDEHVRRLASEGTRPFLPWAKRVNAILEHAQATVAILDALYRDDSEYVRRSVANHLNDLNRRESELAVATAARWLADPDRFTDAVVRRGLRTLVKQGHPGALALLGFHPAAEVVVTGPVLTATTVSVGESLAFALTLHNGGVDEVRVAIDYVVHHVKANGTRTPKVFKLATRTLGAGERVTFDRRHSFRPISTRRYHSGEHAIEVQVNGAASGLVSFELVAPD